MEVPLGGGGLVTPAAMPVQEDESELSELSEVEIEGMIEIEIVRFVTF